MGHRLVHLQTTYLEQKIDNVMIPALETLVETYGGLETFEKALAGREQNYGIYCVSLID